MIHLIRIACILAPIVSALGIHEQSWAQPIEGAFVDAVVQNRRLSQVRNMVFGPDGHVYVSSIRRNNVERYDGKWGTFLGEFVMAESGGLQSPRGMTFGPDGHLYLSSFDTDEVLRFDGATGILIDAFVEAGTSPLNGPAGLAFASDGSLLVSSILTDEVLRYDSEGHFQGIFVTASGEALRYFYSIVFGPDGHLYAGSYVTHEVLRFDGTGGTLIDVFVSARMGGLSFPYSLVFGPDNNLYVGWWGPTIIKYDGNNGRFLEHMARRVVSAQFNVKYPVAAFDPNGQLYAYDDSFNIVFRFHGRTGQFIDEFISEENAPLEGPFGLTFGPDQSLFVASFQRALAIRYDQHTGVVKQPQLSCCLDRPWSPFDLLVDREGRLLVSSFAHDKVVRYDAVSGEQLDEYIPSGTGGLDGAGGMAIDPSRRFLLVGSIFTDEVLRYDLDSGAFIDVFVPAQSGGLDAPHGVHFGPGGNLYVGSYHTNAILRYDGLTGDFLDAFVPSKSGGLEAPQDHTFGPDGHLYVSSLFTNEVLRYDGATGDFINVFIPALSGGLDGPRGLEFGPDNLLYVSSFDTDEVLRFTGPILPEAPDPGDGPVSHYPNPFEHTSHITFFLARAGFVEVAVFDLLGRQVAVLTQKALAQGEHTVSFTAEGLPSGIYMYRIKTEDFIRAGQMILAR